MKVLRHIGSLAFVLGLFTTVFAGIPWHIMVADDPVVPLWLKISVFGMLGGILVVLATLALEQRAPAALSEAAPEMETDDQVLLSNYEAVPDREVTEILGLVQEASNPIDLWQVALWLQISSTAHEPRTTGHWH